jgi:hypothetical protein
MELLTITLSATAQTTDAELSDTITRILNAELGHEITNRWKAMERETAR